MVVTRDDKWRQAAAECDWLGASPSRWKSFLRQIPLRHRASPVRVFPSTILAGLSGTRRDGWNSSSSDRRIKGAGRA